MIKAKTKVQMMWKMTQFINELEQAIVENDQGTNQDSNDVKADPDTNWGSNDVEVDRDTMWGTTAVKGDWGANHEIEDPKDFTVSVSSSTSKSSESGTRRRSGVFINFQV